MVKVCVKKYIILMLIALILLSGCTPQFTPEQLEQATAPGIPNDTIPEIILKEETETLKDLFIEKYSKQQEKEEVDETIPTESIETQPTIQETEPPVEETEPSVQETKPQETTSVEKPTEPQITFEEVNKTMYVTSETLNIRTGPGTSYKKIGSFRQNDTVNVIGIGSNGWNKIKYNNEIAYVSGNYLSNNKVVIETPKEEPTEPVEPPQETKPQETVTYKTVNETVYAISETRIWTGPGTNYEKIGTLKKGASIKRIGIGSNGWSKVMYNEIEAYVSSCYLTTEKSYEIEQETVLEEMQRRGSMGRLNILSHSVALFKTSYHDINQSQLIVDNKDSAAYMSDGNGNNIIADHVHQGFSIIKKAEPNQTIAIIDYGSYTEKYICTDNFIGKNTGTDLVDKSGNSILGKNIGGITMYTCNIDGTVTITYWQLVK